MRFSLARMMGVTFLAALAFAALRTPTVGGLLLVETATAAVILGGFVVAREARGPRASFAFGFAVFGLGYFAALTPWVWGLSGSGSVVVRINSGLPTADLVTSVTNRLAGPAPNATGPVYDAWADRYQLIDGLLHLGMAWLLGALGGGFGVWARGRRVGRGLRVGVGKS